MKTIVLGLGNTLLGDDGVGIHAIYQLQRDWQDHDDIQCTGRHSQCVC